MNSGERGDLRQRAEQIARLEEEAKALRDDVKAAYVSAQNVGYDVKALKQIVKELAMDHLARQVQLEHEAVLDTYRHALGMLDGTPLGEYVKGRQSEPTDVVGGTVASAPRKRAPANDGAGL